LILLGGGSIPKRHRVGQFEIGVDRNAGERASEDDRMGIASGRISEMEAHL